MEKKQITEEMGLDKEWYEEAKEMTAEKLPEFIRHLTEDYGHDYGTIVKAMGAAAIAAVYAIDNSEQGGITGFQASCLNWEFLMNWYYTTNKCGMRLVDYDDMLYPQYGHKYEKTISSSVWNKLQAEAEKNLNEREGGGLVHPDVVAHWKSIVAGNVPFGYVVKD